MRETVFRIGRGLFCGGTFFLAMESGEPVCAGLIMVGWFLMWMSDDA